MKFPSPVSVQWIAEFIGATVVGNQNGEAKGINELHRVEPGDIIFVDHPKYYDKSINSPAGFIIINKQTTVPEGKAFACSEPTFRCLYKNCEALPAIRACN